jgi:hypothetical protein
MAVKVRKWEKNDDSVSVDRGPLTYALAIGEKYERFGGTEKWPAFELLPQTPWNYGLVLDAEQPAKSFEVVEKKWNAAQQPFDLANAPIELKVKARKIPNWKLDPQYKLVGLLQPSPAKSAEAEETVTLVPMGAARLRIAAFPTIGTGPNAHEWAFNLPSTMASHVFDDISAINDGKLPRNSNDHSVPRLTWWNHKGTTEWVQYNYAEPRQVSKADVYWYDDSGQGECRVPKSWRLLYQVPAREIGAEGEWRPVELLTGEAAQPGGGAAYGCKADQFNGVRFKPVGTRGLRLEVQLQEKFSGGILEWRVE